MHHMFTCVHALHLVATYVHTCLYVCVVSVETLTASRSSLQLLEVKSFLDYVKDKFSQVLLPAEAITKQGLLGKGY